MLLECDQQHFNKIINKYLNEWYWGYYKFYNMMIKYHQSPKQKKINKNALISIDKIHLYGSKYKGKVKWMLQLVYKLWEGDSRWENYNRKQVIRLI